LGWAEQAPALRATPELVNRNDLKWMLFVQKTRAPGQVPQFQVGEPVYLNLVLANWSPRHKFTVQAYWHPANDFEIMVTRAGDLPRRFTAGVKEKLLPAATFELEPRDVIVQRWLLCYHPDNPTGFLFDQPGRYTIQAKIQTMVDQTPQLLSFEKQTIDVVQSPELGELTRLILRPDCAENLQMGRAGKETVAVWEEVARRFPKQIWAVYARMLVAWYKWQQPHADYNALAAEFAAIESEALGSLVEADLLDDVIYGRVASLDHAGRPAEALTQLQRIQRDFPLSSYLREGNPMYQKYIERPARGGKYFPWFLKE
jgi:hypothetical protein